MTQLAKTTSNSIMSLESQKDFLQNLIDSGQLPGYIKKVETAFTIAQYGKELGFSPMTSFNYIISIQGKLTLSAKGQQALLRKHGVTWRTLEDFTYLYPDGSTEDRKIIKKNAKGEELKPDDIRTSIEFERDGIKEIVRFYWSDAVKAGLTDKAVWKQYPKSMCWARCFTIGANRIGADLMLGFYSSDEIADSFGADESTVVRNEKGEIIGVVDDISYTEAE